MRNGKTEMTKKMKTKIRGINPCCFAGLDIFAKPTRLEGKGNGSAWESFPGVFRRPLQTRPDIC